MTIRQFQSTVMRHYKTHGRHELPWRQVRDPYAILVSEIMLQQTQVDRVMPYFKQWMHRFPTAQVLASASLSEVLRAWSGLGYNRRAKMLHECAKEIVGKHGGTVPRDTDSLLALPGVGSYTAGAIRAFAFNQAVVFIETNIRAALIHHFFPQTKKVSDAKLVPILQNILPSIQNPREWYSALMDYGTYIKKTHPNPSRRSKHYVKQSKFVGSLREMRGAILRATLQRKSLAPLRRKDPERFMKALQDLRAEQILLN